MRLDPETEFTVKALRGDDQSDAAIQRVRASRALRDEGTLPDNLALLLDLGDQRFPPPHPRHEPLVETWNGDGDVDPETVAEFERCNGDVGDGGDVPAPEFDPLPAEPRTELGYARRFVAVYGDRCRHVPQWRRWLIWDGRRWSPDTTGQAARWMKVIARLVTTDALAETDADRRRAAVREAKRGESSSAVAGALTLAGTEPELAVSPDQLDADPFLLNCANGTLDLRTGQLRGHDPGDLLTKVTGAAYRPDAEGPVFAKFLEKIQPEATMRRFLARLLGHTLEGRQTVHLLPILHGHGANGKSTLVNAAVAALGDYAAPADPDLLFARTFDAHPTAVADLFGLRLAVLHEGDANRRLAEGTVKRLTGGDPIKARRMREDFWTFDPSHTFVLLTNHKPVVAGDDEGIWRRLKLVPFDVVIPPGERDGDLADKLALEVEAVLAWLAAGYQEWRHGGLGEPEAVTKATKDFRAESDALGRFIGERCLLGPNRLVRSSQLHAAWSAWCNREGEEPGSNKAFTTALQNRGFDTKDRSVGRVWLGIGLVDESPASGG